MAQDLNSDMNKAWADSFNADGTVNEHSFTITDAGVMPPNATISYNTENKMKGDSGEIENYQTLIVAPYDKLYEFSGQPAKGMFHTHPYSAAEGSLTGVSFSKGDIAWFKNIENKTGNLSIVETGTERFALVVVDETKLEAFLNQGSNAITNEWDNIFNFLSSFSDPAFRVRETNKSILLDSGLLFLETNDTQKLNFTEVK